MKYSTKMYSSRTSPEYRNLVRRWDKIIKHNDTIRNTKDQFKPKTSIYSSELKMIVTNATDFKRER